MSGINLVLSTLCNITSCELTHTYIPSGTELLHMSLDVKLKTAREMVNGKHLSVGTITDGFRSGIETDDKGKVIGRGIAFIMLNALSETLNFTYDVIGPPSYIDVQNRTLMETWLIELLLANKLDIGAAFVSYNLDRRKYLKFSLELDTINCLIAMEKPLKHKSLNITTLQPFDASVWGFFLLMLVVYIASLLLLTHLRAKLIGDDEEIFTVSSGFWCAYRMLTHQDIPRLPKSSMSRILIMTWSIFAIVVVTYYEAHLSRGYTLNAVAYKDYITKKFPWLRAANLTVDYDDGMDCQTKMSLDRFFMRPSGYVYPRSSSLAVLFDIEIKKLYRIGFLNIIFRNYDTMINTICPLNLAPDVRRLDLAALAGIFYCWAGGLIAAGVIFLAEFLLHKLTKSKGQLSAKTCSAKTNVTEVLHEELTPPTCRFKISSNQPSSPFQSRIVNGRRYLVVKTRDGEIRLVPVDTLSALLYDINSYEKPN